jgi:hypothetical protein
MFEYGKCCGYSEIMPMFKSATCADLYRNFINQFQPQITSEEQLKIYATTTDTSGNTIVIKNLYIQNDEKKLSDIILEHKSFFKPLYPVPETVVYKIRYENGKKTCCCNGSYCI